MNFRKTWTSVPKILDRIQPSGTAVLFGTAMAVGAMTGLCAVLFIELIFALQRLFFEGGQLVMGPYSRLLFIIIPALGGLISGPIITFFAREAKGHGVPEVMKAIALRGSRIRPRVAIAKVIASALCIGSGGSAGREGPIVQIGSTIGSYLGQVLNLSHVRIRNLVACGASAGIAATFNAPIAGVIFTLEVILGELHMGDLGNVVISAVTASIIARIFIGDSPAFAIPNYGIESSWEILFFVALGVLAAFAAFGFMRMLYRFEDFFDDWKFPDALKPFIGGLLTGGLGFLYTIPLGSGMALPHVFGSGFSTIEGALLNQYSFGLLFILILLKPLATSLTLGSGNSGGVFAPSLFLGAVLGGAYGRILNVLIPGATEVAGAYAAVGMAALFAGAAHAPFTAILIVFEMTNDYRLIVPLMASVIASYIVSQKLQGESIYTLKLVRQGIHLVRGRSVDVMESVRVEEIMTKTPSVVSADMPLKKLEEEFLRTGRHGFAVLDGRGELFGIVSIEDYRRVTIDDNYITSNMKVGEISTREVITAYPDESVGTALHRMAPRDLSRLPVVSRDNPREILGVVRRNDIVRAYELGAMRREEARQ